MSFLYQILILLFVIAYFPIFWFQYFMMGKYRGLIKDKLGLRKYTFKKGCPTIWVHAVSVGEIKAVSQLLKKLKALYPNSILIISSITQTGHQEAKKCCPFADHFVLMPVDLKSSVEKLLGSLKLDLILLVETDIWPNFLKSCKKRGAKIVLVNGKVSERSYKRLKKIPFFKRFYFSCLDHLLVQDEIYLQRFLDLGLKKEQLKVVPNLKLDDVYPELNEVEVNQLKEKLGIEKHCITLGSTHPKEEEGLLKEITPLLIENRDLKVLLVPRHPERNDEVEAYLKTLPFTYARYSRDKNLADKQIILIDVMGFLRTCYQLSTLAVVAGSFNAKVGGHNILEPLWYKTPSLFGPHMYTQTQFVHLIKTAKAGCQLPLNELSTKIRELMDNQLLRRELGERGKQIFEQASGGTEQALNFLKQELVINSGLE